jgi:hypothetical protein
VTSRETHPSETEVERLWWAPEPSPDDDVAATENAFRVHSAFEAAGYDPRAIEGASGAPRVRPGGPRPPGGWLGRFVRRHGWRAYALPVLIVVTVVACVTAGPSNKKVAATSGAPSASTRVSGPKAVAPPTATGDHALKTDAPAAGALNDVLQSDALPAGGAYTITGAKTFSVLPGTGPVVGTGRLKHYSIDVENGITGIDLTAFAATVQSALSDPRSWTGGTGSAAVSLQRVDSGPIDFHVTLTSSMTVRVLCGYDIPIETSCYAPKGQGGSPVNRVVLNVARWVRGDAAYIADIDAYREYMTNHETGHALGHQHAHACLPGGLAPAMMQQTIGLKTASGAICQANPWPYPPGAAGAPGAEAPDTPLNNEFNLNE